MQPDLSKLDRVFSGNPRYYPKLSTKVEKELRILSEKGSVSGFLARQGSS